MDIKLVPILAALKDLSGGSLCCPEWLMADCAALRPDLTVLPYFASPSLVTQPADLAIIHKGMLGRLDRRFVANLAARLVPVAGNEVYLLFARPAPGQPTIAPPDIARHLGPIDTFLKHWDFLRPAAEPGSAVIVSAYGAGNVGDDAVTLAAGELARMAGSRTATAIGPAGDYAAIERADLLLVGGGGLFYDRDYKGRLEAENVGNYTAPIRFAREAGKKVAILGIGTQGLNHPLGRAAFGQAVRQAHLVTARDPHDVEVLHGLAPEQTIHLTADLAYALAALDLSGTRTPMPPLAERSVAVVAIAASMGHFRDPERPVERFAIDLVHYLARDHEVVLAQHSADDAPLYDIVARETGVPVRRLANLGVRATLALYASARTVVASRFHGIVFGTLMGARIAPFSTVEGKIGRLVRSALPSLLSSETMMPELSATPMEDILGRARIANPAEVDLLECAALRNADLLAMTLQSGRVP